jgi:hypothetical protein
MLGAPPRTSSVAHNAAADQSVWAREKGGCLWDNGNVEQVTRENFRPKKEPDLRNLAYARALTPGTADPIYKTKIAVTDKVIYVVHYAASGETYICNEQYRDLRFWGQEKTDDWS